jgi:hypothetical protein
LIDIITSLCSPYHSTSIAPVPFTAFIDRVLKSPENQSTRFLLENTVAYSHIAPIVFRLMVVSARQNEKQEIPSAVIKLLEWLSSNAKLLTSHREHEELVNNIPDSDANWMRYGLYSGQYRKVIRKLPSRESLSKAVDDGDTESTEVCFV